MGWKKPDDPVTVPFSTRTTAAEREALDAVIGRWAAKQAALGASAAGTTTIAWFRQMVRRVAAEEGVPVNDPPPPAPAAPRGGKKKARKG